MIKNAYDTEDKGIELSDDDLDAISGGWIVNCGDGTYLVTHGTQILKTTNSEASAYDLADVFQADPEYISLAEFQKRNGQYVG